MMESIRDSPWSPEERSGFVTAAFLWGPEEWYCIQVLLRSRPVSSFQRFYLDEYRGSMHHQAYLLASMYGATGDALLRGLNHSKFVNTLCADPGIAPEQRGAIHAAAEDFNHRHSSLSQYIGRLVGAVGERLLLAHLSPHQLGIVLEEPLSNGAPALTLTRDLLQTLLHAHQTLPEPLWHALWARLRSIGWHSLHPPGQAPLYLPPAAPAGAPPSPPSLPSIYSVITYLQDNPHLLPPTLTVATSAPLLTPTDPNAPASTPLDTPLHPSALAQYGFRARDARRTSPTPAKSSAPPTAKACAHCGTRTTPLWRREPSTGENLCNACGIYFRNNGRHRPIELAATARAQSPTLRPATPDPSRTNPSPCDSDPPSGEDGPPDQQPHIPRRRRTTAHPIPHNFTKPSPHAILGVTHPFLAAPVSLHPTPHPDSTPPATAAPTAYPSLTLSAGLPSLPKALPVTWAMAMPPHFRLLAPAPLPLNTSAPLLHHPHHPTLLHHPHQDDTFTLLPPPPKRAKLTHHYPLAPGPASATSPANPTPPASTTTSPEPGPTPSASPTRPPAPTASPPHAPSAAPPTTTSPRPTTPPDTDTDEIVDVVTNTTSPPSTTPAPERPSPQDAAQQAHPTHTSPQQHSPPDPTDDDPHPHPHPQPPASPASPSASSSDDEQDALYYEAQREALLTSLLASQSLQSMRTAEKLAALALVQLRRDGAPPSPSPSPASHYPSHHHRAAPASHYHAHHHVTHHAPRRAPHHGSAHAHGGGGSAAGSRVSCANCGVQEAPLWRRDPVTGDNLCNACGIYLRSHGRPRPVKLMAAAAASSAAKAAAAAAAAGGAAAPRQRTATVRAFAGPSSLVMLQQALGPLPAGSGGGGASGQKRRRQEAAGQQQPPPQQQQRRDYLW